MMIKCQHNSHSMERRDPAGFWLRQEGRSCQGDIDE